MLHAEPEELRTLLVGQIARAVEREGVARIDLATLEHTVARVLDEPTLTVDEQTLVLAGPGEAGNVVNHVLAARIDRAWCAGLDQVATLARTVPLEFAPTIVALRDDAIESAETFADTLTRGLSVTLAHTPAEPRGPMLVLAQTRAFETLQDNAASLRTLEPALRFQGEPEAEQDDDATEVLCVKDMLDVVANQARQLAAANGVPIEPIDPMIGKVFANKYQIEKCVGRGGFGSVYLATDALLHNRVAIKVLTPRSAITEQQKAAFRAQLEEFKEEARRLVRLEHECIVNWKVFDETEDGTYYFVMELLQGEELHDLLEREQRLAPDRVANILLQVLGALRAAHDLSDTESILHLDLKPKNVFHLTKKSDDEADRVKVIDFGIGQFIGGDSGKSDRSHDGGRGDETLMDGGDGHAPTRGFESPHGTLRSVVHRSTACTPEYASPEQCTHMLADDELARYGAKLTALDGRSDLYSLGVMGFQLLTGQLPFERPQDRRDFLELHLTKPPRKVGSMGIKIPRKLARFVDKCLTKDRDARWADTREAYDALERIVHPSPWKKVALIGAPLVIATAAIAYQAKGGGPPTFGTPRALEPGVYCGVERPTVLVDVADLPPDLKGRPARLVELRNQADATALAWTLAWQDPDHLRFEPPADVGDHDVEAELEITGAGGERQFSTRRFRVRYLTPDAVNLRSISVPDLGARGLDPLDQRLVVDVAGAEADIGSVVVAGPWGERTLGASADASADDGGRTRYTLALGDLGLGSGDVELVATVTDKAARATRKRLETRVVADGLAFVTAPRLDDASPIGRGFLVTPNNAPALVFELNGPADVAWTVYGSNGVALPGKSGLSKEVRSGPIAIDLSAPNGYAGHVSVTASDAAYVLRADSDRAAPRPVELAFTFDTASPELVVALQRAGRVVPLDPAVPTYLNLADGPPVLQLSRVQSDMPVVAEIAFEGSNALIDSQAMTDQLGRSATKTLELGEDGEYRIVVRGFRCDSVKAEKQGTPVEHGPFTFVVDRTPSRLLVDGDEPPVLTDQDWAAPVAFLRVEDAPLPGTRLETPVRVGWRVLRGEREIQRRELDGDVVPSAGVALTLGDVAEAASKVLGATADGDYQVEVTGTDLAGNPALATSYGWIVASDGPAIAQPREPTEGLDWNKVGTPAGPRWQVEVEVTDPNGVRQVTCEVRDGQGLLAPIPVPLAETVANVWAGRVAFPVEWSKRELELWFEAVDLHDRKAQRAFRQHTLSEVLQRYPGCVAVARRDGSRADNTRMRFVEGNRSGPYQFHGQGEDIEDRLFGGLFPAAVKPTESWPVEYATGEIRPFYLDEHEVSVGQFARFVEAADGFLDVRNWLGGEQPDAARAGALRAELAALDDDLPVTRVRWAEAHAYAEWVGKTLPSYPQWEWAVRGADYRPYSSFRGEPGVPGRADFNYRGVGGVDYDAEAGDAPWPVVGRGSDRTPVSGLWNLGSNVSEWTRTPQFFEREGGELPKAHAARNRLRYLDPGPADLDWPSYWAAGSSFDGSGFDYGRAGAERRDATRSYIGFRCALDADTVLKALVPGATGRLAAREIDE